MQCPLSQFTEAPSTGFGLAWILKHVDTSASNERRMVRKEPSKPGGGWDKVHDGKLGGWKWWGWSSGPVNPEEVQRVHVLHRNAGGGGKLLLLT